MRLYLLIFLFICCLGASSARAQTSVPQSPVNLTGTWTLDFKASDFGGNKAYLVYDSLTLLISHNDPVLKITRKIGKKKTTRMQEVIYYTDGRGETNASL